MQKDARQLEYTGLFGRVVSILESSRANIVRSVNSRMVTAYWLTGCEIMEQPAERDWYNREAVANG